jgi:hypothetical protein
MKQFSLRLLKVNVFLDEEFQKTYNAAPKRKIIYTAAIER